MDLQGNIKFLVFMKIYEKNYLSYTDAEKERILTLLISIEAFQMFRVDDLLIRIINIYLTI